MRQLEFLTQSNSISSKLSILNQTFLHQFNFQPSCRSFFQLVGDLSELRDKKYGDVIKNGKDLSNEKILGGVVAKETLDVELDDLDVVATLGVGGFGRVELVKDRKKPSVTYALKCLKKQHIVETQQQEHVFSEKNILMSCRHIFITK